MTRAALTAWIALAAGTAGCAPEAPFDPAPFVGAWRGRWTSDDGRRGRLEVEVTEPAGELASRRDAGRLPGGGRRRAEERGGGRGQGGRAVFDGQRSPLFGELGGALTADGSLVVECDDVRGPVDSLYGHGSWSAEEVVVELDVGYDRGLRTGLVVVELQRRPED